MFDYEHLMMPEADIIRLEAMDYDLSWFRLPIIFQQALHERIRSRLLGYADFGGTSALRRAILQYETIKTGYPPSSALLMIGNGTAELFYSVIKTVLGYPENRKRRNVIVLGPTYPLFPAVVESLGGNVTVITGDRSNRFVPELTHVACAFTGDTSALILTNPSSPTGVVYSLDYLSALLQLAKSQNIFVISDEIYSDTIRDRYRHTSIVSINKGYSGVARLFGPSKDRPGTTGLRIGYCVGDSRLEEGLRLEYMLRNFSVNVLSQALFTVDLELRIEQLGGLHGDNTYDENAVTDYNECIKHNQTAIETLEADVLEWCGRESIAKDWIIPESGNCILIQHQKNQNGTSFVNHFISRGVFCYPGEVFDCSLGQGWFRICFTRSRSTLLQGLERLAERDI
jgi:aspartate/methionine/tyrosine aminotransferase